MKTSIALLLTAVLLLQSGVLLFLYQGGVSYVRFDMQHRLTAQQQGLETLTLSNDEFQKHLVEKSELDFNGIRYDVKSVQKMNGKVVVKALRDRHEERILAWVKEFTKSNSNSSDTLTHQLSQLLSLSYFAQEPADVFFAIQGTLLRRPDFISSRIARALELATPPPEVA